MEFSSAIYRGDPCPEFSFSFKLLLMGFLLSFYSIFSFHLHPIPPIIPQKHLPLPIDRHLRIDLRCDNAAVP